MINYFKELGYIGLVFAGAAMLNPVFWLLVLIYVVVF